MKKGIRACLKKVPLDGVRYGYILAKTYQVERNANLSNSFDARTALLRERKRQCGDNGALQSRSVRGTMGRPGRTGE